MPRRTAALLKPQTIEVSQGEEKLYLRDFEIAERTGATITFIRNLMRQGKLKFKLVGKRHLVKREDVEAYFESLPYAKIHIVKAPAAHMHRNVLSREYGTLGNGRPQRTRKAKSWNSQRRERA